MIPTKSNTPLNAIQNASEAQFEKYVYEDGRHIDCCKCITFFNALNTFHA